MYDSIPQRYEEVPNGETLPLIVCKEFDGKEHIGEISKDDMFISLNPGRACDAGDFRHGGGACVSMVGLGGFALSGVAASADISRRSKNASRQGDSRGRRRTG